MLERLQIDPILIVDDNRVNRRLLQRRLEQEGFLVHTAENGHSALTALKKEKVNLVLLDVMMPDIDGYEVLRRIRERHAVTELPVIMVTARDESADIVRALELGANDFVTKPIDFPVALARIRTHLFLKFKNRLIHALTSAQAQFIATNNPRRVFSQLLDALLALTHSEFGFIGEILYTGSKHPYLKIYADNWRQSHQAHELYNIEFIQSLMQTGTTFKCDLVDGPHEAAGLFEGADPLRQICLYPLSSVTEHLGIVGFANRSGGYGAELSEQLQPVWNTCSNILVGIKSKRHQQEIELALKESEQRTRTILGATLDGIIAIDKRGRIEIFNSAAEEIFGFSSDEVIGQNVKMLMPSPYSAEHDKYIERYLRTGKSTIMGTRRELIGQRKDGSVFSMSLSVSEAISGDEPIFIGVVRNITEEKETREQVRFQKTLLECQSNASLDGILVVDMARQWLFSNRKFLDLWGFPRDIPPRQKCDDTIHQIVDKTENPEAFIKKMQHLYRHPEESSRDEVILKDGRILDRYSAPVQSEEGVFYGRVWYYRDITERKKAEAALALAREREIEIGARIQQTLLLGHPPQNLRGIQVASFSLPSQHIAGDFYDFYTHSGRCLDIVVGDVMGKGIPAALLGAATKSQFVDALRRAIAHSDRLLPAPEAIISIVHEEITEQLSTLETFITACYARIDANEMRLSLVDCGHTKTVHFQSSTTQCHLLKGDNIPLGVFEDEIYKQISVPIAPGDVLFFYSDGLTELQDPSGTYFGETHIVDLIQAYRRNSPQELLEEVRKAATAFRSASEFADDLTCVAVKIADGNLS